MGNPLDVHDDLKREVAFYNMALEAANMARKLCHDANVPFSRPEDFFAEMVKTDGELLPFAPCCGPDIGLISLLLLLLLPMSLNHPFSLL